MPPPPYYKQRKQTMQYSLFTRR